VEKILFIISCELLQLLKIVAQKCLIKYVMANNPVVENLLKHKLNMRTAMKCPFMSFRL
jgi:spore coat protein CotF